MHLSFKTAALEELCCDSGLLDKRFGRHAQIVRLRLLCLWNAPTLRAVTVRPPDRRIMEPLYGPRAMSVCIRDAGRVFFHAGPNGSKSDDALDDVDAIEIFAIGKGSP